MSYMNAHADISQQELFSRGFQNSLLFYDVLWLIVPLRALNAKYLTLP